MSEEKKKVSLSFAQSFMLLEALEDIYSQKTKAKTAVKFYRLAKPLKTLVEDYKELTSKVAGEEGSAEWEANLIEINNSTFAEFDTITFDDFGDLEITPATILKLEPIISE